MPRRLTTPKRWTPADDRRLADLWGIRPITAIAKELKRSLPSVHRRAVQRHLPAPTQGLMTLRRFSAETGYAVSRIKTAAALIGIRFKRLARITMSKLQGGRARRIIVSDEQQEKLLEYLGKVPDGRQLYRSQSGVWGTGKKPAVCADCGRADRPHVARGRCKTCIKSFYRRDKVAA